MMIGGLEVSITASFQLNFGSKASQASGRLDIQNYICCNSKEEASYVFVFLTSDLVILENHVKLL
jgi:hypothetical protein